VASKILTRDQTYTLIYQCFDRHVSTLMKPRHPLNIRSASGFNNRAPRLIPSSYREYSPVPLGLVDYFNSNIHLPHVGLVIATHQCNNEDAPAEAHKHRRDFSSSDSLPPAPLCPATDSLTFRPPAQLLRLSQVPPLLLLLPYSLPDPNHLRHLPRNLPLLLTLRELVRNIFLPLALALTPNVPVSPARAAPPQVATPATCLILPATLDLLDRQFLLVSFFFGPCRTR